MQVCTKFDFTKLGGERVEEIDEYHNDIVNDYDITETCKLEVYECQKCLAIYLEKVPENYGPAECVTINHIGENYCFQCDEETEHQAKAIYHAIKNEEVAN